MAIEGKLMLLDTQDSEYSLYEPEVATKDIIVEGLFIKEYRQFSC